MMFNFEIKTQASNFIVLSIILHALILGIFIFQFPLRAIERKPDFIFLGGILQKQQLTESSSGRSLADPGINLTPADRSSFRVGTAPYLADPSEKPSPETSSLSREKVNMKTYFEEDMPIHDDRKFFYDDLGIEPHLPAYQPITTRGND